MIPDSVTEIGECAFAECGNLKEVTFGSSLATIGKSAFYNCISLGKADIPANVKTIKERAFSGCTALAELRLSEGLVRCEGGSFGNCTSLAGVTLPSTLAEGGSAYYGTDREGAFYKCSALKEVSFAEGTKKIAQELFRNCSGLESIVIPDSIEEIGEYTFAECKSLEKVFFGDKEMEIADSAFRGCTNLAIYCSSISPALIYAVDHDLDFVITGEGFSIPEDSALAAENTSYVLNAGSAAVNGDIALNLNYEIKEEVYDSMTDKVIVIRVPKIAAFIQKSLTVDGELCTDYEEENSRLSIPVSQRKGKIKFSIRPNRGGNLLSCAYISYKSENESKKDIIGVIDESRMVLSINANSVTNRPSINIFGAAPADREVAVFVDDTEVETVMSNKSGNYTKTVAIPDAREDKVYTVKVQCDGNTASTKVKYSVSEPVLTGFDLYYGGMVYDLMDERTANKNLVFVLESFHGTAAAAYSFRVKFENADQVDTVRVTSERNGLTKYVDAKWDEASQSFIADGWFDPDDHDYVPGEMNVYYTTKNMAEDVDPKTGFAKYENLPDEWKNAQTDIITNTESEFTADVTIENKGTLRYSYVVYDSADEILEEYGASAAVLTKSARAAEPDTEKKIDVLFDMLKELGYEEVNIANKVIKCMVKQDAQGITTIAYEQATGDVFKESLKQVFLDEVSGEAVAMGDFLSGYTGLDISGESVFSLGYGSAKKVYNWYGTMISLDAARMQIQRSNLPPAEKARQLKELEKLETEATNEMLLKLMGGLMMELGKTLVISPAVGVGLGAFGVGLMVVGYMLENDMQNIIADRIAGFVVMSAVMLKGTPLGTLIQWIIDPSGYVYEGVNGNRLEGVKATIYYKDPDTGQAILWNAREYSQENPLATDSYGNYAWNVPEGLWQVKYEKEGYETYTTEWMEVPPPQTDVNIAMVSRKTPVIEQYNVYADYASVVFSKYMDPETVSRLILTDSEGTAVPYSLEYDTSQVNDDGKNYAKEYNLVFSGGYVAEKGSDYMLSANGDIKDYAGIAMQEKRLTAKSMHECEIWLPETVTVANNKSADISVKIKNYTGQERLTCVSGFEEIAAVENVGQPDETGMVKVSVSGKMKGETILRFHIEGTNIYKELGLTVADETVIEELPSYVSFSQSVYVVSAGESIEINPEIYNDGNQNGTWTFDSSIVSINGNMVTGKKEGITVLRYSLNENSDIFGECLLRVTAPGAKPEKKDIAAAEVKGIVNKEYTGKEITQTFTVSLNEKSLTWNQDYSVEYRDNIQVGTATVMIRGIGAYKGTLTMTFLITDARTNETEDSTDEIGHVGVKVSDIQITGISNSIAAGKSVQLTAWVSPSNAANKGVIWSVNNGKYAKVTRSGKVTLLKKSAGKKVTVYAAAADGSGKKASYVISSKKGIVKKISITGKKTVKAGKSLKLKAKITATKGANKKLKWTSSNTKYAAVSSSGKVKTYKAGKGRKVKITAAATDGSNKKKSITIKIQ